MAIDVARGLREQQVGVFFVMPRVVRRVLQNELDITSPWQPPPHRKCCVISRDRLLWVVALDELGVDTNTRLPDQLILVAQPEDDELARMTRQELQRYYWQLMFHARIDFSMAERTRPDQMSSAELRHRIDQLGQVTFDEIRGVLRAEQMLLRPDDDRNVYAEFVAVYHEFQAFSPQLLPIYFPSLAASGNVLEVIGPDCDAFTMLEATRPSDLQADDASGPGISNPSLDLGKLAAAPVVAPRRRSARQYGSLVRRAERLSAKGNNARAAIALQAACEIAPEALISVAQERLHGEIQRLVSRLQAALEMSDIAASPWLTMFEKLLPGARRGFWNANARLLYDLQNVCFDHEHEIYKVDLLRWCLSLGKTPLKRPLSNQRVVLMSKHLRAASLRVPNVDIDPEGRQDLNGLLHHAADAAEHILRVRIEPLIEQALHTAGFAPSSVVERVSLKKMVHELADGVVHRGFITLGSLRDTVSRNQLKMADLNSFDELISGDPLLRADRLMAAKLDGVYPRGPFYLRWLQKATSVAFGISWGRFLVRYIAMPFGLSFLLLKTIEVAAEHLPFLHPAAVEHAEVKVSPEALLAQQAFSHNDPIVDPEAVDGIAPDLPVVQEPVIHDLHAVTQAHKHVDIIYSHQAMFLLGLVIFSLMHFPGFRRRVIGLLKTGWTVLRVAAVDIPRAFFRLRWVDRILKSFPMMLMRRFMLAPLLATFVFWWALPWFGLYDELNRWWGLAIFLFSFIALNSRVGRDTEELAREFFARTWYRIRVHLLMGLLTLIIDIFHALMDGLERVLYAVDEWLRFRSGESNLTLGVKAVIGLVWSFIHGVVRFCVTLLIEPQVNPIKHFPVVTVSHKLVLTTLTYPIFTVLEKFFDKPTASTITLLILTSVPGVFGFLAWELKENWKLYKANRSRKLKPVLIGEHGETLLRLLRPGFHSGTIPRLFAKQRRASRRDARTYAENNVSKFVSRLQHESAAVRHFFERELVALLSESRTFRDFRFAISQVELTTNRILIEIKETSRFKQAAQLEFSEQSGWLIGVVRQAGWLEHIEPDEVDVFKVAVTGLYKLASVDLVREQIESELSKMTPPKADNSQRTNGTRHPYDIAASGLVIWPNGSYESEVHYPLDEVPVTHPRPRFLARACGLNPLPISSLVFRLHDVSWEDWRRFWDHEQNIPAHSTSRYPFHW